MAKKAPYGKLHLIQDQLDAAVLAFFSTKDGAYTLDPELFILPETLT